MLSLSLMCLGVYGATRSISLDDFDSFNFARAIDHFDVRLNQPQAPGYPVYVALAKAFDLAFHNHLVALTLLSAVCGTVAVALFYLLSRDLRCPWAAPMLAVMPLFWLSSEIALSDVPGLLFAILAVFLMNRAISSEPSSGSKASAGRLRYLMGAGAAAGVAAGVRPQDVLVPASVFVFYVLPQLIFSRRPGRSSWREMLGPLCAFLVCSLLWLVPLVRTFPSLETAYQVLRGQAAYVGATDSLFARPLTAVNVTARLSEFGDVFGAYLGGVSHAGLSGFLATAGAALVLAVGCRDARLRWLALTWLVPYAVFALLAMRPDDPRKILPLIPPLLLLFAGVWTPNRAHTDTLPSDSWQPGLGARNTTQNRPTRSLAAYLLMIPSLALIVFFSVTAVPLLRTLHTQKAPTTQAAEYIRAHFNPRDSLVIAGSSYNAVRYLDPEVPSYLLDDLNQAALERDLSSGAYQHVILLDKEGPALPESYVGTDTRTFTRNPLVLPKASEVWMQLYQPVSTLTPEQFALPNSPLHIGTREDVRYLLEGWYRPEEIAGSTARWTDSQSRLRFWIGQPIDMTMTLHGVSFQPGQRLVILVNDQVAAQFAVSQDWAPYTVTLPATLFHAEAINSVTLQHAVSAQPFIVTGGLSLDHRPLSVAYSLLELEPA